MKFKAFSYLCLVTILIGCADAAPPKKSSKSGSSKVQATHSNPKRDKTSDKLHGITIADPYRWMEKLDLSDTKKFIKEENTFTQSILAKSSEKGKINEKLQFYWNRPKYSLPERHGKFYFTFKNTGLQNQDVLYKHANLKDESTDVVLDLNKLSPDGVIALKIHSFSHDNKYLAYGITKGGSEWITIKVLNIATGKDLKDEIKDVQASLITWTTDDKGFFYSRYPNPKKMENHSVYYHRLGESQSKDTLIFNIPEDPLCKMIMVMSNDKQFFVLYIAPDNGINGIMVISNTVKSMGDLRKAIPTENFTPVAMEFDARYEYIANDGPKIILRTNHDAPNEPLISIEWGHDEMVDFIPEDPHRFMAYAQLFNKDKLLLKYVEKDKSVYEIRSVADGKLIRSIPIEKHHNVVSMSGDFTESELFYEVTSYLPPTTTYRLDLAKPNEAPQVFRQMKMPGFDETKFEVEETTYKSKDNTDIPIVIVKPKNMNGLKKCFMHGYGGFGDMTFPDWNELSTYFLNDLDGFLAYPNIRGNGHKHRADWHDLGMKLNKQNAFDDFQWAAKFLVTVKKYTEHKKIVIRGQSHGGLLIAACINQAPQLFGVAISMVPVTDMLRFDTSTIGKKFIPEFGDKTQKDEFNVLYGYSPLHKVHKPTSIDNQYPATMIVTGDNDNIVSTWHSLKYAAELLYNLKDNPSQKNHILLRVYESTGHGGGTPVLKMIEQTTDILTFVHQTFNPEAELADAVSSVSLKDGKAKKK